VNAQAIEPTGARVVASAPRSRYVITCAVSSPTNPGPAVGAYMVRLDVVSRLCVVRDLGASVSTHRAVLLTIAEAIKAPRAQKLPVVVRTNQRAAVQAILGGLPELQLHPGALALDEGVSAVLAASREVGATVTFEFVPNASGDADLAAARDAAQSVAATRRPQ
jgi:hypothetical protein